MKKNYLILIFVCFFSCTYAQITLNQTTSVPQIGESLDFIIQNPPTIGPGSAGPGQTWDLSGITGTATNFSFISLASSLEPANFPLTDVVEHIDGRENFYSYDSDELSYEGSFIPGQLRVTYTDDREFLKFPITYNDEFNENFDGVAENIAYGQSFDRSGTIHIMADSYGSLILPYTTVNNVLRVRVTCSYTDYLGSSLIASYVDTVYYWYDMANDYPVAAYTVLYVGTTLYYKQAMYLEESDLQSSIENTEAIDENPAFFPNPGSDKIWFSDYNDIISIEIIDLAGRKIDYKENLESNYMDVSFLEKGMYIVNINKRNTKLSEYLIIQ
ncbi:MAG: hypothetical protein A2W91_09965 [Bacteroidetes bacterium GWF2_38_335]|nr:MAG: hypothetical protein A2W91_09965 [Bacteroidetes bacterium GWF2_38_335]HBS88047.1 hypothetical protein [Bacteroidales bacterium]